MFHSLVTSLIKVFEFIFISHWFPKIQSVWQEVLISRSLYQNLSILELLVTQRSGFGWCFLRRSSVLWWPFKLYLFLLFRQLVSDFLFHSHSYLHPTLCRRIALRTTRRFHFYVVYLVSIYLVFFSLHLIRVSDFVLFIHPLFLGWSVRFYFSSLLLCSLIPTLLSTINIVIGRLVLCLEGFTVFVVFFFRFCVWCTFFIFLRVIYFVLCV